MLEWPELMQIEKITVWIAAYTAVILAKEFSFFFLLLKENILKHR